MLSNLSALPKSAVTIAKRHGLAAGAGLLIGGACMPLFLWANGTFTVGDRDLDHAARILGEVQGRRAPVRPAKEVSKARLVEVAKSQAGKRCTGKPDPHSVYDAATADMCLAVIDAREQLKGSTSDFDTFAQYDATARDNNKDTIDAVLRFIAAGIQVATDEQENKPVPNGWATFPMFQEDALALQLMHAAVRARDATRVRDTAPQVAVQRQKTISNYYRRVVRFCLARVEDLALLSVEASSADAPARARKDRVTKKGNVYSDWVRQVGLTTNSLVHNVPPIIWYRVEVRPERFADKSSDSFQSVVRKAAAKCVASGGDVRFLLVLQNDADERLVNLAETAAGHIETELHRADPHRVSGSACVSGRRARVLKRENVLKRHDSDADVMFLYDRDNGAGEFVVKRRYGKRVASAEGMHKDFIPAAIELKFGEDVGPMREEFLRHWQTCSSQEAPDTTS